jgi:hypothetical protein
MYLACTTGKVCTLRSLYSVFRVGDLTTLERVVKP